MRRHSPLQLIFVVLAVFALFAAACGDDDTPATEDQATVAVDEATTDEATTDDATTEEPMSPFEGELVGTFTISAASCAEGAVTGGSYFRMLQPGGTLEAGPYIENFDSACGDFTYSALAPGTDGGLFTGVAQPAPDPAFDADGNGLAAGIAEPVTFFGVDFAAALDPLVDPPTIVSTDGVLSGDTSGFTAYYGGEAFNQGAPKPDGLNPGLTAGPTGTIDLETGEYVLEWTTQIVGGAFNDFTGVWHLEGTFTPVG